MNKKNIMAASLVLTSCTLIADENSEYLKEARSTTKQFGMGLKGHLQSAMKAGGPITAIGVCNIKAPQVANNLAEKSGWKVARTSLKVRNLDNKPDSWELKVLQHFETEKANGTAADKLEYSEQVKVDGKPTFRYMKAILTAPVCLNCHSGNLKPAIAEKIDELYPQDQARGFKKGDIRGAFSLEKTL